MLIYQSDHPSSLNVVHPSCMFLFIFRRSSKSIVAGKEVCYQERQCKHKGPNPRQCNEHLDNDVNDNPIVNVWKRRPFRYGHVQERTQGFPSLPHIKHQKSLLGYCLFHVISPRLKTSFQRRDIIIQFGVVIGRNIYHNLPVEGSHLLNRFDPRKWPLVWKKRRWYNTQPALSPLGFIPYSQNDLYVWRCRCPLHILWQTDHGSVEASLA
mmetsp:Transcript_30825/g.65133  ORF Transcript_30825/g.65133 Transcript_30825/m.65133 type:complete len:210 (+) Transcript_30825:297-926(+)